MSCSNESAIALVATNRDVAGIGTRRTVQSIHLQSRGSMSSEMKTRFRSAEEALRFFFRLRELLYDGRAGRLLAGELPVSACATVANAIDDYPCIGSRHPGVQNIRFWVG